MILLSGSFFLCIFGIFKEIRMASNSVDDIKSLKTLDDIKESPECM